MGDEKHVPRLGSVPPREQGLQRRPTTIDDSIPLLHGAGRVAARKTLGMFYPV